MDCNSQHFCAYTCSCNNAKSTIPLSDSGTRTQDCMRTMVQIQEKKFPSLSCGISVVLNLITGEDFQVSKMQGKVRTAWESGKATEVFLQTLASRNESVSMTRLAILAIRILLNLLFLQKYQSVELPCSQ